MVQAEFGTHCWDLNHGGGEWGEKRAGGWMSRRWGEKKQRRSWQALEGPSHKQVWESRTPGEEVGVHPVPSARPAEVGDP